MLVQQPTTATDVDLSTLQSQISQSSPAFGWPKLLKSYFQTPSNANEESCSKSIVLSTLRSTSNFWQNNARASLLFLLSQQGYSLEYTVSAQKLRKINWLPDRTLQRRCGWVRLVGLAREDAPFRYRILVVLYLSSGESAGHRECEPDALLLSHWIYTTVYGRPYSRLLGMCFAVRQLSSLPKLRRYLSTSIGDSSPPSIEVSLPDHAGAIKGSCFTDRDTV